ALLSPDAPVEVWCGPKQQAHLSLGQEGFTSPCRPRSKDPIDLSVRCGLPRTRRRRRPRAPACNTEAMQLHLDEIATKNHPGAHAILLLDQAGVAWRQGPRGSKQHLVCTCATI